MIFDINSIDDIAVHEDWKAERGISGHTSFLDRPAAFLDDPKRAKQLSQGPAWDGYGDGAAIYGDTRGDGSLEQGRGDDRLQEWNFQSATTRPVTFRLVGEAVDRTIELNAPIGDLREEYGEGGFV